MAAFDLHASLFTARRLARDFLDWWGAGLRACVPGAVRRVADRFTTKCFIEIRDDAVVITRRRGGGDTELLRLPRNARDRAMAPSRGTRRTIAAVLRLDANQVFRRRIRLPAAAEVNLAAIIANDIERQSPFAREQIYFDYAIGARDKPRHAIEVDLVVAKRSLLDPALVLARAHGFGPSVAQVQGMPSVDLLRWTEHARPRARQRRANAAILAITLAAGGGLVHAAFSDLEERALAASREASAARAAFQRSEAVRREIEELERNAGQLLRKKQAASALRVVHEVTRLLPDDAWLHALQISGREVRVSGHASDAPALINALQGSETLQNARFRAPVTRSPNTDLDRFEIGLDIRAGGLP